MNEYHCKDTCLVAQQNSNGVMYNVYYSFIGLISNNKMNLSFCLQFYNEVYYYRTFCILTYQKHEDIRIKVTLYWLIKYGYYG